MEDHYHLLVNRGFMAIWDHIAPMGMADGINWMDGITSSNFVQIIN
jgi:hypothetical protein